MSEATDELHRQTFYREALAWLKDNKKHARWESTPDGVRCFLEDGEKAPEQATLPGTEAARQTALIHAVDEWQNS